MQNYIIDIHGRFGHPLDISTSVLGSGTGDGETVAIKGFYASRQAKALSPAELVDRIMNAVREEIYALIPGLSLDDDLSLEVDSIDVVPAEFRAANRGFTFYAED